jgi:DNA-binding IclR family transcriptional regulator
MIDRVASVLEVFEGQRRLTLAQISRRAQLPRSSAHRILQRLVEFGWVERDGYGYTLGLRMFELGSQVARNDRLHRAASPLLAVLHRATGLAVHLSTLSGTDVVHLEQLGGGGGRAADWAPGSRTPAVHAAPGRALLARLSPGERPPLDVPAPPTPYGIRTAMQLERELCRIRERGGIAVDGQGCVPGVTVVAAAIGPGSVDARMAVSVSGPCQVVRVERVAGAVRTTAMDVWRAATGVAPLPRRLVQPIRAGRAGMAV